MSSQLNRQTLKGGGPQGPGAVEGMTRMMEVDIPLDPPSRVCRCNFYGAKQTMLADFRLGVMDRVRLGIRLGIKPEISRWRRF